MKHFKLQVERQDTVYDEDQPTWYGEVLADDEDEAKSIVLKLMDGEQYKHEVTKVEEIKDTEEASDESRTAGVLTGSWEW